MMSGSILKASNKQLGHFTKELESEWDGGFTFIQGADTQYGMIEDYLEHKPNPGWTKEIALTKQTVRIINAMKPRPRFFIICGDLVHAFPGDSNKPLQEADLREALSELDPQIPVICVCGNHDIGNTPTQASIQNYRDVWGDDYFTFWVGGVRFIVINSQFYADRSLVEVAGRVHDEWFIEQLEDRGAARHTLLLQHIPWFLERGDENDQYFNIDRVLREKWLPRISHAGVSKILCGHYHRNAGGWLRPAAGADPGLELVVTSAIGAQIGDDGSGFRLITVTATGITHQYLRIEDYPQYRLGS